MVLQHNNRDRVEKCISELERWPPGQQNPDLEEEKLKFPQSKGQKYLPFPKQNWLSFLFLLFGLSDWYRKKGLIDH